MNKTDTGLLVLMLFLKAVSTLTESIETTKKERSDMPDPCVRVLIGDTL